jgi:hypothetical protein
MVNIDKQVICLIKKELLITKAQSKAGDNQNTLIYLSCVVEKELTVGAGLVPALLGK